MWKEIVEPGMPQKTIRRMRNVCWITKATDISSEYVIIIVFPQQQRLHESASFLHYTFIACLAHFKFKHHTTSACGVYSETFHTRLSCRDSSCQVPNLQRYRHIHINTVKAQNPFTPRLLKLLQLFS
jgi:hypothetical protein